MGKQIRRTITITLTETWTFVWAKTDDAPEQTITVEQTTAKEAPDATLPLPISTTDPATPSGPDLPASPFTPDTVPALPPDAARQAAASRKYKRAQGQHAKRSRQE